MTDLERISVEVTNRCAKACWFCYSRSAPAGDTTWTADDLVAFVRNCAANGVKAVSLGGGEPLEFAGVYDVLARLRGVLFRSVTSNGMLLANGALDRLVAAAPDKVHLSIHFPERESEVDRVIRQVDELSARGIRSGINLLVARSRLAEARRAADRIREAGIGKDRVVYLPMRIQDTPTPEEVASVAGGGPFQSMSCLSTCGRSPRFCSISWDRRVGWCSYTETRASLAEPTWRALTTALDGLGLAFCGGA